jgi:hypothetical protein
MPAAASSDDSVVVVEEAGLTSIRVDGCDEKTLGGPIGGGGGKANLGEHIGVGSLERGGRLEPEGEDEEDGEYGAEEDGENYSDYINPSSSKGECGRRRCEQHGWCITVAGKTQTRTWGSKLGPRVSAGTAKIFSQRELGVAHYCCCVWLVRSYSAGNCTRASC